MGSLSVEERLRLTEGNYKANHSPLRYWSYTSTEPIIFSRGELKEAILNGEQGFGAMFKDNAGYKLLGVENSLKKAKLKDSSLKEASLRDYSGTGMTITDNALQSASLYDEAGLEAKIILYEGAEPLKGAIIGERALMYPTIIIPDEEYTIPEYLQRIVENKEPVIIPQRIVIKGANGKAQAYVDMKSLEVEFDHPYDVGGGYKKVEVEYRGINSLTGTETNITNIYEQIF